MTPQLPAEGILLQHDYGECKCYVISCECTDPDHEHFVEVEADNFGVTVATHTTERSKYFDNFWDSLKRRISITWNIWVNGTIEYESSIIMTEQQAINYAETLKLAVSDVKQFKGIK